MAASVAWATPLHRLVASALGALVLVLTFVAFREGKRRLESLVLLGLTLFLAVLGIWSGGLHSPAIVMGNLAGGFCMLGLLGWMMFSPETGKGRDDGKSIKSGLAVFAIVTLSAQIVLGGLTSANFAATSCRTLPDCHGSWMPGSALVTALDLSRSHEVTSMGQAIGGQERIAIHKTHRIGAVLSLAAVLAAGLMALLAGRKYRSVGILILILAALEFAVGVAAVLTNLPISLAVAHNWLAALLLLSLLKLLALNRSRGI
jgi:cytochrome c oxidase assembly protein subunit 15